MKPPLVTPPWFVRKTYGWGWVPATWQGWTCMLVFVAAVVASALWLLPENGEASPALYLTTVVGLTLILITVSWLTGEPPRWQWGNKNDHGEQ